MFLFCFWESRNRSPEVSKDNYQKRSLDPTLEESEVSLWTLLEGQASFQFSSKLSHQGAL